MAVIVPVDRSEIPAHPGGGGILGGDAAFPGDVTANTAFDVVVLLSAPSACGNGTLDVGEQCDLGAANNTFTNCCAANCQFKPDNTGCDDLNSCTGTDVCTSGVCQGSPLVTSPVANSLTINKALGGTANLTWLNDGGPYNLYRGTVPLVAPFSYNHSCGVTNTNPPVSDPFVVQGGTAGYYYLISRRNSCGESILGADSHGAADPNASPCP